MVKANPGNSIEERGENIYCINCNTLQSRLINVAKRNDQNNYINSKAEMGPPEKRKYQSKYTVSQVFTKIEKTEFDEYIKTSTGQECSYMMKSFKIFKPESINLIRGTAFNKDSVEEFFNNILLMEKYKFRPDQVYNLD